jgi:hypothetical protein
MKWLDEKFTQTKKLKWPFDLLKSRDGDIKNRVILRMLGEGYSVLGKIERDAVCLFGPLLGMRITTLNRFEERLIHVHIIKEKYYEY